MDRYLTINNTCTLYIYIENNFDKLNHITKAEYNKLKNKYAKIHFRINNKNLYCITSPVYREILSIKEYSEGVIIANFRCRLFNTNNKNNNRVFVEEDTIVEDYIDLVSILEQNKIDKSILDNIKEVKIIK